MRERVDAIEWMMDILEHRNGPEPADMPFNGIDFYLHEICAYSPETVRRMIKGGHLELAVETAMETHGVVPGMEAVLRELADHPDYLAYYPSQVQLARYCRVLHPGRAHGSIRHLPNWSADCDTYCFHWGKDRTTLLTLVLYPKDSLAPFDDALAWSLIDKFLPTELRGEPVNSPIGSWNDGPAEPLILGNQLQWSYAAGPSVRLDGDVTTKIWQRIEINGGRLGKHWSLPDNLSLESERSYPAEPSAINTKPAGPSSSIKPI
jgi:hypothetical protein